MKNGVPPGRPLNGQSDFVIAPAEGGWQVTIHRRGRIQETIPAASRAEACRLARTLSDAGLVGFIQELSAWAPRGGPWGIIMRHG